MLSGGLAVNSYKLKQLITTPQYITFLRLVWLGELFTLNDNRYSIEILTGYARVHLFIYYT